MKEEIKETLDYIEDRIIPNEKWNKIKDYITNLQEENEELKKNQRYYKNGVFSLEYDKETMSDIIDEYKSRNEKAIEYIKENDMSYYGAVVETKMEIILNILKGDKDE